MARSVRSISAIDTSGWTVFVFGGDWAWPAAHVEQRKIPDQVITAAILAISSARRAQSVSGYDTSQAGQEQGIGHRDAHGNSS
jgi:hypothetical protein